jgi:HD-GYP domain-containing protein (c-di-GMP phosphodiesterase class II)
VRMRLSTRAFLWSFVPFALLLAGSFWMIQRQVQSAVREGLRSSLREAHESMARTRGQNELQNSRFLRIVAENPSLKAGLQLLLSEPKSGEARVTVEDQLRQISESLSFDFLVISDSNHAPLAGVLRIDNQLVVMDVRRMNPPFAGFFTFGDNTYQVNSFSMDVNQENIGYLSIGEHFDLSEFGSPTVLAQNGKVLRSSVPRASLSELEASLGSCTQQAECEVRLAGETYLTLPSDSIYFGQGYMLRSFQSVDSVNAPVQGVLRRVFVIAGLGAMLAAAALTFFSSRSIVRPIASVVARLREGETTGVLPVFQSTPTAIREISDLTNSFNRTATSLRESQENLQRAYVEFVESLASSLDARDDYTAGHSRRVSDYSCAIAKAMRLPDHEIEIIRVGGLLHDVGKIGVPDDILRKPGKLTSDEMSMLRQHPTIGRRILEGVHGFQAYLPIVELHHENWDGSGYPLQQCGLKIPLCARIVHVADTYDAMTTARPYRSALSHEDAIRELQKYAAIQFDPEVVQVFIHLEEIVKRARSATDSANGAGLRLVSNPKVATGSDASARRIV